jgi:IS30 family transposase
MMYPLVLELAAPKFTDLSVHSPGRLLEVAAELDGRPRKTLEYRTPAEAFEQLLSDPKQRPVATTP